MRPRSIAGALALLFLSLAAGCGGGGGPTPTFLTSDQQQAVTTAVRQTMTTGAVLSPLTYLGRATPIPSGTCPQVNAVRNGAAYTLTVDYGAGGCTGGPQGSDTFTGAVTATADTSAGTGAVTFQNLTINGDPVNGTITVSQLRLSTGSADVKTAEDVTVGSVGRIAGDSALSVAAGGMLTISSADLTLTPNSGPSETVSLSGVVLSPQTNGNFAPQSGTATVIYPATGPGQTTLTLTFSPQTPKDGTVGVSVNGGPSILFRVPGVTAGH